MLNLLPEKEKKQIRKEYYLRLSTLVLFFVTGGIVLAGIGLLPSYFLEKNHLAALKKAEQLENNFTASSTPEEVTARVNADKQISTYLLKTITSVSSSSPASIAFSHVIAKQTPAISFTTISYTGSSFTVSGVARTRDDLIAYYKSLNADTYFKGASFPINDIANKTDNSFTIQLTL